MSEAADAFDALTAEFFAVWLRFHPDLAYEAGVAGYEHLLPAHSDDALAALGGWLETLVVALEELDFGALDADRRIDLQLMFGAARLEHQELLTRDWRHRDPLRFLPVSAIHRLTLQPPANVREALASLLAAVPEHLRLAAAHLRPMAELVPVLLVDAAMDQAERGRCYLSALLRSPWLRHTCYGWSEIERLFDAACTALTGYREALRAEVRPRAAGRLGCGEEHLRIRLRLRHFLDLDPGRARAALGEALAECEAALEALRTELGFEAGEARLYLARRGVDRARRLDTCRREVERLEVFLRQTGVLSLPRARLRVVERHACPSPRSTASFYIPDRAAQRGTLYTAAGEGDEPRARVRARCLDGGWAGQHLLAFAAGDAGWRLPRRLSAGEGFSAAWSLYLRERLAELGFLDREDRLLALLERAEAIRLALLDLDLHSGGLDANAAGEGPAVGSGVAVDDLVPLVRRPGTALAGVLGWQALRRARTEAAEREGRAFRESRFHDHLLANCGIPPYLMLNAQDGDACFHLYPAAERELGTA
jgi:uncharacterized protein (DUF885 family)